MYLTTTKKEKCGVACCISMVVWCEYDVDMDGRIIARTMIDDDGGNYTKEFYSDQYLTWFYISIRTTSFFSSLSV